MSTKIGTTLGGGVSCGTNIGGGVTILVVDTIFGSGSSPLGSRKETLRFAAGTGGNRGFGAGVGGQVGSSGDGVGGSIGDLGIQLEKMSRSLEISVSCSCLIVAGASLVSQDRKFRAWEMRSLSVTVGCER